MFHSRKPMLNVYKYCERQLNLNSPKYYDDLMLLLLYKIYETLIQWLDDV